MLTHTGSCPCTKTTDCEWRNIFAFRLPSLWSEIFRVLEIFLRKMVTDITYSNSCSCLNCQTIKIVISECISRSQNIEWPISSCYLLLKHLNITKILQVFIAKVIFCEVSFDLFSQLFLNFRMASDFVYHHLCII